MNNEFLIKNIGILLEGNLFAKSQKNFDKAYENRFIGYRSELDYIQKFSGSKILDGGYILPTHKKASSLNEPIYFTISFDSLCEYKGLYQILSKKIFSRLFFISYSIDEVNTWRDIMVNRQTFKCPNFTIYEFIDEDFTFFSNSIFDFTSIYQNSKKNIIPFHVSDEVKRKCFFIYLNRFDRKLLIKIYVERLVFDGLIGTGKIKGIASDIDCITVKNGRYNFIEIKEKDLSKRKPQGFGMDVRRMEDMVSLSGAFNIDYYYVVKEVDNQKERRLKGWWYIPISKFYDKTKDQAHIKGGGGMSSLGSNYTLVCDLAHFNQV